MALPASGSDGATDLMPRLPRLVAVAPTTVGAVLALWGLGTESLWLDEATSLVLARVPFGSFWRQAAGPEINATAYYLLLRGWVTFGTDEAWIRLLSALFAITTIPLVHVLGRRLFGEPRAAIAALVLATSPFFIEFAQEARGYSLALLLGSSSSLAFLLALERSTFTRWTAWAFLAGLGLYAHFFTVFVVVAQLVVGVAAAILEHDLQPRLRSLTISTAAVGLMAVPILIVVSGAGRDYIAHIPRPTPYIVIRTLFLVTGGFAPLTILVGLLATAAAVGSLHHWRRGDLQARERVGLVLAWAWLLIPPLASLAISLVKPIFYPRYLIVMVPGIAVVAALGVSSIRPYRLAAIAATVLVAVSLAGSVRQAATLSKEDWRGAAAIVLDRAEAGDGIAFVSASVAKPFAYYVARSGRVASAPSPIWPTVEWLAPNPVVSTPDPAASWPVVARHDRVWLAVSHENRSLDDLATIVDALRQGHVEREVIALRRLEIRLWVRAAGQLSGKPASSRSKTTSPRSASASMNRRGLKAASGGWTPAGPPRAMRSAAIAATVPVMAADADRPVCSTAKS